jgi:hypothetical protein
MPGVETPIDSEVSYRRLKPAANPKKKAKSFSGEANPNKKAMSFS